MVTYMVSYMVTYMYMVSYMVIYMVSYMVSYMVYYLVLYVVKNGNFIIKQNSAQNSHIFILLMREFLLEIVMQHLESIVIPVHSSYSHNDILCPVVSEYDLVSFFRT